MKYEPLDAELTHILDFHFIWLFLYIFMPFPHTSQKLLLFLHKGHLPHILCYGPPLTESAVRQTELPAAGGVKLTQSEVTLISSFFSLSLFTVEWKVPDALWKKQPLFYR